MEGQVVVVKAVRVAVGRGRVLNLHVVLLGPVFGGDWILLFVEYKGEWEGKVVDWGEGHHGFVDFFLVEAICQGAGGWWLAGQVDA